MGSHAPNAIPITQLVTHNTSAPIKTFTLTAEETKVNLGNGKSTMAWTFNGTSPGPEIRVEQGDHVVVHLYNKLPEGVTIHWHGVDVPGAEDGIAGVTQNAVKKGGSFTYSFIADQPGTYWYHSHQDSSNETGRGLFGVFVVEPKRPSFHYDKDYAVALHEWNTTGQTNEEMGSMNMSGMGQSGMGSDSNQSMNGMNMNGPTTMPKQTQQNALTEMMSMYDVFTANGTSEGLHLNALPGDLVLLRIVNAGNMTHLVTLVGSDFRIIAMDGHDITGGTPLHETLLPIGGAQRYDVAFRMPKNGTVSLVDADPSKTEQKMIGVTFGNDAAKTDKSLTANAAWFDFSKYGTNTGAASDALSMNSHFTVNYSMKLGAGMGFYNGKEQMVYTINGKVFPNVPPIEVNKGDVVKVHITNDSPFIHPMHLHGHSFEVLTRNGKPLSGSSVYLDTLNVLPGESYNIAFVANNPGLWMFHCHDLHHAAAGMDTMVVYKSVSTPFTIGKKSGNNPE